jgi:hypothetical protein
MLGINTLRHRVGVRTVVTDGMRNDVLRRVVDACELLLERVWPRVLEVCPQV